MAGGAWRSSRVKGFWLVGFRGKGVVTNHEREKKQNLFRIGVTGGGVFGTPAWIGPSCAAWS